GEEICRLGGGGNAINGHGQNSSRLLDLQQGLVQLVQHRQHARPGGIGLLIAGQRCQLLVQVHARIGRHPGVGLVQPVVLGGLVGGDRVRLGGEVLVEGGGIVRERGGLGGNAAGGAETLVAGDHL